MLVEWEQPDQYRKCLLYHKEDVTLYTKDRLVVHLTITIMDIIQRFLFYFEHDVSETGFCLRL
jgi:hypothetical protein